MKNRTLLLKNLVVRKVVETAADVYGGTTIDIPNGYEYVRFDFPKRDDWYINNRTHKIVKAYTYFRCRRIIVREVPYFKCHCAIENHNDVGDPGTFCPVCKGVF